MLIFYLAAFVKVLFLTSFGYQCTRTLAVNAQQIPTEYRVAPLHQRWEHC